jgi:hypothetical protein
MKINGLAAARIADVLNNRGILSPHEYKKHHGLPHPKKGFADHEGAKWSATSIIRILTDETYTGNLVQGKQSTPNYKLKEVVTKPTGEWQRVEKTHEAIIPKHSFDLAQRIMRLDTRTSPDGETLYVFSGILICGSCGSRMTRYTVPSGGKKYYYYRCPTGKKNGCEKPVMLQEKALVGCVLDSLKSHIANVASLDRLIENLDTDRIAHTLSAKLTAQLAENECRLEKSRMFKAALYESMSDGNLSKEEYKSLKAKYMQDTETLVAANNRLQKEIDDALSCKHERIAWIEHFREFANLETIDRKTVVHFIKSIRILGKNNIEIAYNFQDEYETALAILQKEVA